MLPAFVQSHLALEHAEDEDKVGNGEDHANRPPHKPDSQPVCAGLGVVDSQLKAGSVLAGSTMG